MFHTNVTAEETQAGPPSAAPTLDAHMLLRYLKWIRAVSTLIPMNQEWIIFHVVCERIKVWRRFLLWRVASWFNNHLFVIHTFGGINSTLEWMEAAQHKVPSLLSWWERDPPAPPLLPEEGYLLTLKPRKGPRGLSRLHLWLWTSERVGG